MKPSLFTSTKRFIGFPCTHRQWRAESHCKYIHGYSREFYFEFQCRELTKEGWVVDFGGLKEVRTWLEYMFDHTFLASDDDPHLSLFKEMDANSIIQLRVLPNVGMEGTAHYVYEIINEMIKKRTNERAWVKLVKVSENDNNSAIYSPHLSEP